MRRAWDLILSPLRQSSVKIYLFDKQMSCRTRQSQDYSEIRTSSQGLRSTSQEADIEQA